MPPTTKKPNVIVFFTDQQRWDTTGVHGNPLELTPNFDRMAKTGTHAFNAFTPQPVCGPARSCVQTGQYATKTGCFRNGIALSKDAASLAKSFKAGGYDTAYIGKWHLAQTKTNPVPPDLRGGYDFWLAADTLELMSDAYDCRLFDGEGKLVKLPGYRVDAQTDAAIGYIDQHQKKKKDQPFLLFMSFLEPHFQNHRDDYPAPTGYADRYNARWTPPDLSALISPATGTVGGNAHQNLGGYYGMVKRLDECLGRLQDALRSLGMLDETIIVFTSDHGCHFKTRNSEYKRSAHESSIRLPMALTGPGFDGGGEIREMVSLVDLMPTLLDAAGLPVPPGVQGRSILPLLNGKKSDWPQEAFIQISETQIGRAVRTQRWKYGVVAADSSLDPEIVPGVDRYIEDCLFDLDADPYELTNLIGMKSHRKLADRLSARVLARMKDAGEGPALIEPAPEKFSGPRYVTEAEIDA